MEPTKLTGPPITRKCTAKNFTFSMTNKTKKTQSILVNTGTEDALHDDPGRQGRRSLRHGPEGRQGKFYITGSKSVLTVTLS